MVFWKEDQKSAYYEKLYFGGLLKCTEFEEHTNKFLNF